MVQISYFTGNSIDIFLRWSSLTNFQHTIVVLVSFSRGKGVKLPGSIIIISKNNSLRPWDIPDSNLVWIEFQLWKIHIMVLRHGSTIGSTTLSLTTHVISLCDQETGKVSEDFTGIIHSSISFDQFLPGGWKHSILLHFGQLFVIPLQSKPSIAHWQLPMLNYKQKL